MDWWICVNSPGDACVLWGCRLHEENIILYQYVLWYYWTGPIHSYYSSNHSQTTKNGWWIGLAKREGQCDSKDWHCRRQNWLWEDGSPYTSYQASHLWHNIAYLEPNTGDLGAQLDIYSIRGTGVKPTSPSKPVTYARKVWMIYVKL